MKKLVLALILISLSFLQIPKGCAATDNYGLRAGDVISINLFGHPELSFPAPGNIDSIIIRPDGRFSYPFVGEILAEGLTPQQLAQYIFEQLAKYYVNPRVTVNVMKFSTERVYVLGQVNAPGLYELDKSRNLLDAIGSAKGWTKDAAKTKVFVIRKDQKGEPTRVNLMELFKKGDVSKNIPLKEGDVVFLTENQHIDILNDILPLTQIYYNLRVSGVYGGSTNTLTQ